MTIQLRKTKYEVIIDNEINTKSNTAIFTESKKSEINLSSFYFRILVRIWTIINTYQTSTCTSFYMVLYVLCLVVITKKSPPSIGTDANLVQFTKFYNWIFTQKIRLYVTLLVMNSEMLCLVGRGFSQLVDKLWKE